jgi:hypothetical protein
MSKVLRFALMSLVMGLLLSGLTFFINRSMPVNLACATAPNKLWTPDGIGTVFNKERNGWPFIYHEKVRAEAQKCYSPANTDTGTPYNGARGEFVGYSTFKLSAFVENVVIWGLISLGLDLYLNYVFMPKRAVRKKK